MLLFDVLHLMPARDQETLLSAVAARLEPGGLMVIREADASAGWRFRAVWAGNRVKALAFGEWRQQFHFRSDRRMAGLFRPSGSLRRRAPDGRRTPFANVLFRVTRREALRGSSPGTV